MKKKVISDAITNISNEYIEKAADYTVIKKSKKMLFIRWGTVAACFSLILALIIPIAKPDDNTDNIDTTNNFTLDNLSRPYKDFTLQSPNMAVAWKWEYLTIYEKYLFIDIEGIRFARLGEEINASAIAEKIGTYEAVGDNSPYDTPEGGYHEMFDAYTIDNISPDYMIALKMEDSYYCFISDVARAQIAKSTFGTVLDEYGLLSAIGFSSFSKYCNGKETEYFSLKDDSYIREVLTSCKNAPCVNSSEWKNNGNYCSFTITSDVLGIYKKAFYVTEDGYIWTNILDVACIYNIGKEAADKIITYSLNNSDKTTLQPYQKTVVGTITDITNEYILIDDSILCKNASDGITFKIMLNNLRINRYVDDNRIKVGDTVEIVYKNSIDTTNGYVIDSAISASNVTILDGIVGITE